MPDWRRVDDACHLGEVDDRGASAERPRRHRRSGRRPRRAAAGACLIDRVPLVTARAEEEDGLHGDEATAVALISTPKGAEPGRDPAPRERGQRPPWNVPDRAPATLPTTARSAARVDLRHARSSARANSFEPGRPQSLQRRSAVRAFRGQGCAKGPRDDSDGWRSRPST